jgi:hypothetical protein
MPESDIVAAPQIQPRNAPKDEKWRQEYVAFLRLLPELLKTHRGRYVAVHNSSVVATADTFTDAALEAYRRVGYVPLHVGLVSDVPSSPVRLPSSRAGLQVGSA